MTALRAQDGVAPASQIRSLAGRLTVAGDLDPLIGRVSAARLVCIGEASHRTHEYYPGGPGSAAG